jgi:hypothetical protein
MPSPKDRKKQGVAGWLRTFSGCSISSTPTTFNSSFFESPLEGHPMGQSAGPRNVPKFFLSSGFILLKPNLQSIDGPFAASRRAFAQRLLEANTAHQERYPASCGIGSSVGRAVLSLSA